MSKLSKAQRDKLPDADFAGPHRSFPIVDQQDVHKAWALRGHADDPDAVTSKIATICKRKSLKCPDKEDGEGMANHSIAFVEPYEAMDLALFNDAAPPGYVRRTGPIFRPGTYEDKQFSLSVPEMDQAITQFEPISLGLEHVPTVLDGQLGIVRRVWRDGDVLFGMADVPEWLDKALRASKSTVSCAWDRAEKRLAGLDWVLDPRVSGAALMGAYANFRQTEEASQVNPQGAGSSAMQPYLPKSQVMKGKRNMPLAEQLRTKLNAVFSAGATGATGTAAQQTTTPTPIPTSTVTAAVPPVAAGAPVVPAAGQQAKVPPTIPATVPFSQQAAGEEPAEDEGMAEFRANQIITRATELVDQAIGAGHLQSSGRKIGIALFSCLGMDNEQSGPALVTFASADGNQIADRVQMLSQLLQHVPSHSLFAAQLPVNVYNGNRSADETRSAAEQGADQAKKWNEGMSQSLGVVHSHNGNGSGNGVALGNMP